MLGFLMGNLKMANDDGMFNHSLNCPPGVKYTTQCLTLFLLVFFFFFLWEASLSWVKKRQQKAGCKRLRFPATAESRMISLPFDGLFCASISRVTINLFKSEQSASCSSRKKGYYNMNSCLPGLNPAVSS